jgi:hypothetical protein
MLQTVECRAVDELLYRGLALECDKYCAVAVVLCFVRDVDVVAAAGAAAEGGGGEGGLVLLIHAMSAAQTCVVRLPPAADCHALEPIVPRAYVVLAIVHRRAPDRHRGLVGREVVGEGAGKTAHGQWILADAVAHIVVAVDGFE